MSTQNESRRIYVASLSDYNAGVLHGVWIDCDGKDADDIQEEVNAMLRTSKHPNVTVDCPVCGDSEELTHTDCEQCDGTGSVPSAEEWAIHDTEGFGDLVGESTSFERVAELCEALDEHGDAFLAFADNMGGDVTVEQFQEAYQGEHSSESDWAQAFLEDTGALSEIPEKLRYYFDFDAYARDAQAGGDVFFVRLNGSLYCFWNH